MNDIGWAVKQMRNGDHVQRSGWNGKDMYIAITAGQPANDRGDVFPPFVFMRTVQNGLVPWLCSQTDLLATDWQVVDG